MYKLIIGFLLFIIFLLVFYIMLPKQVMFRCPKEEKNVLKVYVI